MQSKSALLKGSGSTNFQSVWPHMQPVVLKLLKQEQVTRDEWQDHFWYGRFRLFLLHYARDNACSCVRTPLGTCITYAAGTRRPPVKYRRLWKRRYSRLRRKFKRYVASALTFSGFSVGGIMRALFLQRVLLHQEESALLKAYISEWIKFFEQCDYLPKPFQAVELEQMAGKAKKKSQEGNKVQVVCDRNPSSSLTFLLFHVLTFIPCLASSLCLSHGRLENPEQAETRRK